MCYAELEPMATVWPQFALMYTAFAISLEAIGTACYFL